MTDKGTIIRHMMNLGLTDTEISKRIGFSRTTINYYRNRPDNLEAKRTPKLPQIYINKIIRLASNKTTSQMSGGAIANIINEDLEKNKILNKKGEILAISKRQVNRILKKKFGVPRKIKKVFYLTEEQKKKRMKFCHNILKMDIEGKNILFTDETIIDTSPYTTGESIRLTKKKKKN